MIKKNGRIAVLLSALLFCSACGIQNGTTLPAAEKETSSGKEKIATYDNVGVNIAANEDGFYNLMSDIEVHYYDDHISYITVNQSRLLAFQVSSKYKGGVWVMNLDDGQKTINELTLVAESLRKAGNYELASSVEASVKRLTNAGPYTKAST